MPITSSRRSRPGIKIASIVAGGVLLLPGPARAAVFDPVTFEHRASASTQVCEVRTGADGRTLVVWHTNRRENGRTHERGWMATLDASGRLADRQLLTHTLLPPYPKKGFGWRTSCPTVMPGPGRELEVAWQRTRLGYYPPNSMIGIDKPSALVRRSRDAAGRWGPIEPWIQASTASYWQSVERVQWVAGEGRSGLLLLQRRLAKGPQGLRVEVARRDAEGRWGRFHRDRRDLDGRRLERTAASVDGRWGQIYPGTGPQVMLALMQAGEERFRPPAPLTGPQGCRRVGNREDLRISATASTISVAWPCRLDGESTAIGVTQLGWDGAVRSTRLVADARAVEEAAVPPPEAADSYPGRRHPLPTLGALVATGDESLRISWLRARPFASDSELPTVFEATFDGAGPLAEAPVLALPQAAPNAELYTGEGQSPAASSGRTAGSDSFTLVATTADAPSTQQVIAVMRDATGVWRSQLIPLAPRAAVDRNQPSVLAGQAVVIPWLGSPRRVGVAYATSP